MKLVGGSRRGMPTLYGIVQYWRGRYGEVFPNLQASYVGWGEPFCFRCGWLAPVDDTQTTLAAFGTPPEAGLTAHTCRTWPSVVNGPENLVPLCRQCHDIMDPCESRAEAIAYVNDGILADSWWQIHTDAVFGSEANLGVPRKTKIMRDTYTRWVEQMRVMEAAKRGDPQAVKRLENILESARRRAEHEGRSFAVTIDDLRAANLVGDRTSTGDGLETACTARRQAPPLFSECALILIRRTGRLVRRPVAQSRGQGLVAHLVPLVDLAECSGPSGVEQRDPACSGRTSVAGVEQFLDLVPAVVIDQVDPDPSIWTQVGRREATVFRQ